MSSTIRKKKKLNLISNTLTKLPKAVYLIRLLTSHLLVRVSGNLYSCATFASSVLLQGRNVLYVTMEMAEEKIAERIDANLLDVSIQDLSDLPKLMFENKVTDVSKKTQGQLIIKEYPTAGAHSGHFKTLLNELALKKSFKPDIIFIDYLNICASSRYRAAANVNSYSYIKAIAEELRGLAVEANVPIVSATQTTRSVVLLVLMLTLPIPLNHLVFLQLLILCSLLYLLKNSKGLNQIMVKQLKNRYNDPTIFKRFVIGIDRAKMRLYDCEQKAQEDILDSGQEEEYNKFKQKPKKSFAEFKF